MDAILNEETGKAFPMVALSLVLGSKSQKAHPFVTILLAYSVRGYKSFKRRRQVPAFRGTREAIRKGYEQAIPAALASLDQTVEAGYVDCQEFGKRSLLDPDAGNEHAHGQVRKAMNAIDWREWTQRIAILAIGVLVGGLIVHSCPPPSSPPPPDRRDGGTPDLSVDLGQLIQEIVCPAGASLKTSNSNDGSEVFCEIAPNVKEGPYINRWRNGNKRSESYYQDGHKEGLYISWYEDGTKRSEANYKDGQFNGKITMYYPSGKMQEQFLTKNDLRQGLWRRYYDSKQDQKPQIQEQGQFDRDKQNGEWKGFYEDGKPSYIGYYDHGKKVGKWSYYDEDGHELIPPTANDLEKPDIRSNP